jgi:hypothetical protein
LPSRKMSMILTFSNLSFPRTLFEEGQHAVEV